MGTSYRSRLKDKKFVFAGKTGTSQIRRITARQRELEIKNEEIAKKVFKKVLERHPLRETQRLKGESI